MAHGERICVAMGARQKKNRHLALMAWENRFFSGGCCCCCCHHWCWCCWCIFLMSCVLYAANIHHLARSFSVVLTFPLLRSMQHHRIHGTLAISAGIRCYNTTKAFFLSSKIDSRKHETMISLVHLGLNFFFSVGFCCFFSLLSVCFYFYPVTRRFAAPNCVLVGQSAPARRWQQQKSAKQMNAATPVQ